MKIILLLDRISTGAAVLQKLSSDRYMDTPAWKLCPVVDHDGRNIENERRRTSKSLLGCFFLGLCFKYIKRNLVF